MQLSEKELEKIISSVPPIGPYHAGAGEAARLIAEKMAEGVVWQDLEEKSKLIAQLQNQVEILCEVIDEATDRGFISLTKEK